MGNSVLVTGCAGFIGSHVVEKLLETGHEVLGIDNFDPFYAREIKERNMRGFVRHPKFSFLEMDICDAGIQEVIDRPVDLVIHLAAKAGVRPSIENPKAYLQVNVQGSLNILEWMRWSGVRKMVFASSSSVYGNNNRIPFSEDDSLDLPISPYAFTKKACELQNHVYHVLHGMDILNLRFFTVYGERQRPDLAIHKFTKRVLKGDPIQLYGDGSSSRDYTYVDDTVAGIIGAMEMVMSASMPIYETFNLGNSHPIQLAELVAMIEKKTGKNAIIERRPMQPGDVERTFADISKAADSLNYHPETTMEAGIEKFVAWMKQEQT
jgi:UDP-glucuronate 4-epimerase